MVCNKCNKACDVIKDSVKCLECQSEFHVTCSRIRTAAKFNKMTPQEIAGWRCDSCKTDPSLMSSEDATMLEVLKAIKLEIAKNNQENRENFASLKKDIASVNQTLINFQSKIAELESENSTLRKQFNDLKEENYKLSNFAYGLQSEISELQQYTRSNNIEIKGIPVTRNENIYTLLENVAAALNVSYNGGEVSIAHRLQSKDKSQPPNIVVQFVSRYIKNEWISAATKKHITTSNIAKNFAPAPVYVNEHLTAANKALLGKSKFLVRETKLHAAWTRNGTIYVRKTSESRT